MSAKLFRLSPSSYPFYSYSDATRYVDGVRRGYVRVQLLDRRLINLEADGHRPGGSSVGDLDWLGTRVHDHS